MRLGKIEYLNLIIFDIFIKKYPASSSFKYGLHLKKSYPSKLSYDYLFGRIDAGFISSITEPKSLYKSPHGAGSRLGIIAQKEVWSVLVLHEDSSNDYQSATSNALCKVLDLNGRVLIGDRALGYFYTKKSDLDSKKDSKDFTDMAWAWYEKNRLPFVFGRLCFHGSNDFYEAMTKDFIKKIGSGKKYKGIKIPHYIIMKYVTKLNIDKDFARKYIEKIFYVINSKERAALKRFYRSLRLKGIKSPKRF